VQRLLNGAASLFRSIPFLLTFQKAEHSLCVINSVNFCGVEAGNIAQFLYACCNLAPSIFDATRQPRTLQSQNSHFVTLDPFLVIVILRQLVPPTEPSVRT